VNKFIESEETKQAIFDALNRQKERSGLDFSMLMVTNVVAGSSRLLISEDAAVLNDLPYPFLPDGIREAKGVVSRKKQLLPVILGLVED
jgi:manganese-dependent inorganic pyrophosphatase